MAEKGLGGVVTFPDDMVQRIFNSLPFGLNKLLCSVIGHNEKVHLHDLDKKNTKFLCSRCCRTIKVVPFIRKSFQEKSYGFCSNCNMGWEDAPVAIWDSMGREVKLW